MTTLEMFAIPSATGLASVVIDGATMMPLGVAAGLVIVVWKLSRRYAQFEDTLQELRKDIRSMRGDISTLPCKREGGQSFCPRTKPPETNFCPA